MTNDSPILVVVSHYAARGVDDLNKLFKSMSEHEAGHPYDLLIVSNDDNFSETKNNHLIQQKVRDVVRANFSGSHNLKCSESINHPRSIKHTLRPNIGMNLGAWDIGWRLANNHEHFMFMQDEVCICRGGWIMGFIKRWATLPGKSRRSVRIAVIGESLNTRWEKSWDDLAHSPVNYPIQSENGIDRVSYYRHAMQCWNIKPQKSASHLRSLILFVNRHTLERIGGFHIGQTKEKCIAAEIAFSQSIKALNGFVGQVNPSPFFFMRHREWHVDTNGQVCKVSSE